MKKQNKIKKIAKNPDNFQKFLIIVSLSSLLWYLALIV